MHSQHNYLIIALAVISACGAHIRGGPVSLQNRDPQVFCGRTLAKALAMLCNEDISGSKRADAATIYDSILGPYNMNQETQVDWPWMSAHKPRSMGFPSRGKRYPGIVNECCEKACSINELLTYC